MDEDFLDVLILATQWADLLWPILLLAGVEHVAIESGITAFNALDFTHYPWSHSLLMGLVWGLVFGGLYFAWKRHAQDALIVGVLVPSHWLLDFVVHRPDLPLWPGGPEVGLGLWNSVAGTLVIEVGVFAIGNGSTHRERPDPRRKRRGIRPSEFDQLQPSKFQPALKGELETPWRTLVNRWKASASTARTRETKREIFDMDISDFPLHKVSGTIS